MSAYPPPQGNYSLQEAQSHTDSSHPLADRLSHHGLPSQSPYFSDQQQQQQLHQAPPLTPGQQHGGYANGGGLETFQQNTPESGQAKQNRLRKACDSCSIRKVKCDESGPPCKACASLDIPCTFERPSRRRGPPNRHAEAIKKRRVDSPVANHGFSSPASPNNVAATLASFSSHAVLSAESICPFSMLELLVDDFFTYIHPLAPFPHEPSFRGAFRAREDLNNPSFLALLASMVGALVASFPRKPRLHLKAHHREKLFPSSISLVERCHKVAVEARGPGYLDKELTVYDAATSYFLGLAAAYTFSWPQARLYLGETLNIARAIGVHRVKDPGYQGLGSLPLVMGQDEIPSFEGVMAEPIDYIRQEIGRRVFWVMFVGIRSMQQLGASFHELHISPPTPSDPYPPFPLEIDDEFIYVDHVELQPPHIISRLTGFNTGIHIYMTVTPVVSMELAYGIDEIIDWSRQKRVLENCLIAVKSALLPIPRELMLNPVPGHPGTFADHSDRAYYPPAQEFPGARSSISGPSGQLMLPQAITAEPQSAEERRLLQYEIQKANIYASQLGTRSYIVEKYWNLVEAYERMSKSRENTSSPAASHASPDMLIGGLDSLLKSATQGGGGGYDNIERDMVAERENIVKDLLQVLGSINQVNMEPNGGSFINKIRQIASTLLDKPRNRRGPSALANNAEEYLVRFLDILMKLERVSPGLNGEGGDGEGEGAEREREEEELRNWADLRVLQERFLRGGGFGEN